MKDAKLGIKIIDVREPDEYEIAHIDGVPLYPFLLDGVAMDPQFNQPDGLHPNERGVAVMVDNIAPYIARLIGGS